MASGADMPLTSRSFINMTGPGAVMFTKPVVGSPSVLGQVSSRVALPVMVTSSPCLMESLEKFTLENVTVSMRRKASCAFSPWAEATKAVPIRATTPSTREISRRWVICRPPLELLHEAADRPDRQPARNGLSDPVAGDRAGPARPQRAVLTLLQRA